MCLIYSAHVYIVIFSSLRFLFYAAKIVPKFYYVPESVIETDSMQTESIPDAQQHSLHRVPSQEKMPFLWAQALYLLARLIRMSLSKPYFFQSV